MYDLTTHADNGVEAFAKMAVTQTDSPFTHLKYTPDAWQYEIVKEDFESFLSDHRRQFAYWLPTGTGKTIIQTMLAAVLAEVITRQKGRAPTAWVYTMDTLKTQWASEIGKIDPRIPPLSANPLDVFVIDGTAAERKAQIELIKTLKSAGSPPKFVITNYDTLRLNLLEIADAMDKEVDMVFLDEADQIQNPNSDRGKAARVIADAYVRVVASASLMYNKIDDLHSVLQFLAPADWRYEEYGKGANKRRLLMPHTADGFGSLQTFLSWFAFTDDYGNVKGVRNVPELHRRLRAMGFHVVEKRDVLDLPDLNVSVEKVRLDPIQQKVYNMAVEGFVEKLEDMRDAWSYGEERGVMIRSILAWLTAVRRATSLSPRQYVNKMLEREAQKNGLTFRWEKTDGDLTDSNAKLDWMRQYALEFAETQGGCLFYSQWTDALDAMHAGLKDIGAKVGMGRIDGAASDAEREKVRQGVLGGNIKMVLTSNAGGRGLNLQKLNRVVANDIPWTPTELLQVAGRIERRGQENEMWFHYLIAEGTIDEKKMLPMILNKAKDQDAVAYGERGRRYESALGTDNLDEILGWL